MEIQIIKEFDRGDLIWEVGHKCEVIGRVAKQMIANGYAIEINGLKASNDKIIRDIKKEEEE